MTKTHTLTRVALWGSVILVAMLAGPVRVIA
jgi:hypothetical protein